MQEYDRYCDVVAGSTINAMNTSAKTSQIHDNTTSAHTTGIGFLRRCMADALLVTVIVGTAAVGLAAMSHADTGDQLTNTEVTTAAPAPFAPWFGFADPGCRRPLYYFNGRVHCG